MRRLAATPHSHALAERLAVVQTAPLAPCRQSSFSARARHFVASRANCLLSYPAHPPASTERSHIDILPLLISTKHYQVRVKSPSTCPLCSTISTASSPQANSSHFVSTLFSLEFAKLKQPKKSPLSSFSKMSELWIQCFSCCVADRPQNRRRIDRSMIGNPTNFRHTAHVGTSDMSNHLRSLQHQMASKGGYDSIPASKVSLPVVGVKN